MKVSRVGVTCVLGRGADTPIPVLARLQTMKLLLFARRGFLLRLELAFAQTSGSAYGKPASLTGSFVVFRNAAVEDRGILPSTHQSPSLRKSPAAFLAGLC